MARKINEARKEARSFVGDGSLRDVLQTNKLKKISDEAIQKIMNVTKQKASGQRRINIPKSEKNLESE